MSGANPHGATWCHDAIGVFNMTQHKYHFTLGNSSSGSVGYCARITTDTPEAAVERLKLLLPENWAMQIIRHAPDEYVEIYFNHDAISVDDIDMIDDADINHDTDQPTDEQYRKAADYISTTYTYPDLEIDADAKVSRGEEWTLNGAWVHARVWVREDDAKEH